MEVNLIYLKTFKLSNYKIKNKNIYPFNVLDNKEPDIFIFDNITVLYGNLEDVKNLRV